MVRASIARVDESQHELESTTSEGDTSLLPSSSALTHWLVVAVAPRPEFLGHRMLASGLVVGRSTSAMFRNDRQLSRRHAAFTEFDGGLDVVDLDSRNGTWSQGRRIAKKRLAPGEYLRVGAFGFVVARAPAERQLRTDSMLVGDSHVFQRVLGELEAVAASRLPVLVWGPPGSGRSAFCSRAHALSGRARTPEWVDVRGLAPAALRTALFSAIERAAGGTLVLEAVETLPQECLGIAQAARAEAERADCRLLATAHREDAFGAIVSGTAWTVRLPPLSERRDDIPQLLEHASTQVGAELNLTDKQRERLVTRSYEGHVAELFSLIERAHRVRPEHRDALFGVVPDEAAPDAPVMLARDGQWLVAGGARADFSDSPTLAAVLRVLINGHLAGRRFVPTADIAAEAWQGERILPRAASNRIYVAVNSLRRVGLRGIIVRGEGGYALEGNFVLSDPAESTAPASAKAAALPDQA
jgi:hypothetical protein